MGQVLRNVLDANLKKTKALPNGAASTTSDAIDLGHNTTGAMLVGHDLLIEAPALAVGPMADAKTMKYTVLHSDNADLSSPSNLYADVLTQTGAGGAGAGATSVRVQLPGNVKRYVGVKATGSASGDASGSSFTASLLL